ncbi:GH32 C-terminal domain-containing protein [Corynebacterium lizhenjunii]|uniref:GH32 C-terminal domain-containing protein n=1 Tax=Corynebacterium lizhenjunii TaxID=2709394 RepID=UPI0013EB20A3|nr:GH32 C-terminal domain-containing protein [Corynebacterium lizhenjunii]
MTYRPELHLAPEAGVLEAPAGVLLDGSTWHLFYQYRPAVNEPTRWGHSYAEDTPFDWLECDDVLAPAGGEIGLRAGAVAQVDANVNLYYTSITSTSSSIRLAKYSDYHDTHGVSDDPLTVDPLVMRHGEVISQAEGFSRFRSPCVVPDWETADRDDHAGWLMLALSGSTENPTPVLLRSPDGDSWTFEGALTFNGDTGFATSTEDYPPVVSPRIIRLRDEVDGEVYDILFFTIEAESREIAGYLVGTLHGTQFDVVTGFRRLDFGHDFTRPRNTNVTEGTAHEGEGYTEACILGLLNGRGRADDPSAHHSWHAEGWANALSLPRHLTLQGGVLYQTPPRGLPDAVSESDRARLWTGMLEVPEGSGVTVTLLDGEGQAAATITHAGSQLQIDRSPSRAFEHTYADDAPATAPLADGDEDSLTIVIDGSALEVYADSGLVTMASRMYIEGGCSGFSVETSGEAAVLNSFERAGSRLG